MFIEPVSDAAKLSKHLVQLTSSKSGVNKHKDDVVAKAFFDKIFRQLSPGKYTHRGFNSATVKQT